MKNFRKYKRGIFLYAFICTCFANFAEHLSCVKNILSLESELKNDNCCKYLYNISVAVNIYRYTGCIVCD